MSPADPDGPSWLDAQILAHCVLPRENAPATCAETIYLMCGGESGRHLDAIVAPLLIHDLPVTVWWPDEPPFGTEPANDVFDMADRLVVDGSTWHGTGLSQIRHLAALQERQPIAISDFALVRQSRWREAIASIFDIPDFLPYLRHLRRISVTYGVRDEGGVEMTNVVKPVYHAAWLASRLGMRVERPLAPVASPVSAAAARHGGAAPLPTFGGGLGATLRLDRTDVAVVVRPVLSEMPPGTTLRIELRSPTTAAPSCGPTSPPSRTRFMPASGRTAFTASSGASTPPRRTDVDLLDEAIEAGGRDPVAVGATRMAAELAGGPLS